MFHIDKHWRVSNKHIIFEQQTAPWQRSTFFSPYLEIGGILWEDYVVVVVFQGKILTLVLVVEMLVPCALTGSRSAILRYLESIRVHGWIWKYKIDFRLVYDCFFEWMVEVRKLQSEMGLELTLSQLSYSPVGNITAGIILQYYIFVL